MNRQLECLVTSWPPAAMARNDALGRWCTNADLHSNSLESVATAGFLPFRPPKRPNCSVFHHDDRKPGWQTLSAKFSVLTNPQPVVFKKSEYPAPAGLSRPRAVGLL